MQLELESLNRTLVRFLAPLELYADSFDPAACAECGDEPIIMRLGKQDPVACIGDDRDEGVDDSRAARTGDDVLSTDWSPSVESGKREEVSKSSKESKRARECSAICCEVDVSAERDSPPGLKLRTGEIRVLEVYFRVVFDEPVCQKGLLRSKDQLTARLPNPKVGSDSHSLRRRG